MSSAIGTLPARGGVGLRAGLWVAQVLLALAFGAAGAMKLAVPIAEIAKNMPWVADMPGLVRFIGASEVAGALGMLLPSLTRIAPKLTPLAAVGLLTIMVLAAAFHASRGEYGEIPVNAVLGGIAAFVAWGRFRAAPISPR